MRIAHSQAEVAEGFARARSEAQVVVRRRPRVHREVHRRSAPHRNPGARRQARQRHLSRRTRMLDPAPQPEGDRGSAESAARSPRRAQRMGEQAVALAKAVGYDSAGTVEFVAGQDKSFYFLEMNTRLQVEHPVTELVTGIDLVEQMIRVAAGEKLALTQDDVKLSRAGRSRAASTPKTRTAISCPRSGGWCAIGRRPKPSDGGITVRNDTGVTEGGEISLYYDPMIAKLVTHGPTREEAIAAQADALDAFTLDGIRHNIPFLAALMSHKRWQAGRAVDRLHRRRVSQRLPAHRAARRDGADARRGRGQHRSRARRTKAAHLRPGVRAGGHARTPAGGAARRAARFRSTSRAPGGMRPTDSHRQRFCRALPRWRGRARSRLLVSAWKAGDPLWSGTIDGRPVAVQVRPALNGFDLSHRGVETRAFVYTEREAQAARLMPAKKVVDSGKALRCPMPGLVVSIAVVEGQEVKAGETLRRGRGDEDGERAARRARRRGEDPSRPSPATAWRSTRSFWSLL